MADFNDLIRRTEKIAREEGIFDDDSKRQEILPSPERLKRQGEKLSRAAQRLKEETGVDVTQIANSLASDSKQPTSTHQKEMPSREPIKVREEPDPEDFVQEQIDVLEKWVNDNIRLARKDFIRFWVFKTPAIICSVSVAAFESFGYGQVNIILGVITAFCVGIDALFPGGRLHNAHKRAANEARRLQHNAIGKWRKAQLDKDGDRSKSAQDIIDYIQKERTRIDKYLTDTEASLGVEDR